MNLCKSNHMAYNNTCYLISITKALNTKNPDKDQLCQDRKWGQALDLDAI